MIVSRLLEMKAIEADLVASRLEDNLPASLLPTACIWELGTQNTHTEQSYGLTQKMGVRRSVGGKKTCDVTGIDRKRTEQVLGKRLRHDIAIREEERNPQPRKAPERYFKARAPIDAKWINVLLLPGIPLREAFVCKPGIVRQTIGLCENHQVLVAVQFPRDFGVSDLVGIEIVDPEIGLGR